MATFLHTLQIQCLKHQPDYILYRDKENKKYELIAEQFIQACKKLGNIKSFLHQRVDLAKSLGADGVHLTSKQFEQIKYAKSVGLEVIISTHSYEEVKKAQSLGADAVTYSPVFFSPDKGEPKGVEDLKELVETSSIHIFALGGIIEEKEVALIKTAQPYGFASIRYFF